MPPLEREAPFLARARHGDRAAFDELVLLHYAAVHAFLLRQTRSTPEAEDLAQETFVRAWRSLASFDAQRPLAAWLTRIAWHLFLDRERVRARRGSMRSLDAPDARSARAIEAPAPSASDPRAQQHERELDAALDAAVARLPEPLRLAFVLRVLEGRAYDEVAAIAGVKPATARTHVAAARERLERALAPYLEDPS
jgi:RNA polymerase sigma-70 factor (ECF subfamily)